MKYIIELYTPNAEEEWDYRVMMQCPDGVFREYEIGSVPGTNIPIEKAMEFFKALNAGKNTIIGFIASEL